MGDSIRIRRSHHHVPVGILIKISRSRIHRLVATVVLDLEKTVPGNRQIEMTYHEHLGDWRPSGEPVKDIGCETCGNGEVEAGSQNLQNLPGIISICAPIRPRRRWITLVSTRCPTLA